MDGKVLGIERRRRWSKDEKARIVEETLMPGAVVSEVARRHGVAQSLLFTWRRLARTAGPARRDESILLPVEIDATAPPSGAGVDCDGPHRHASRHAGSGASGSGAVEARSARRRSLPLPRAQGRPGEDSLARRRRAVALCQAARPGKVHLAVGEGGRRVDLAGADGLHAGRNRLEESATDVAAEERGLSATTEAPAKRRKTWDHTLFRAPQITRTVILCVAWIPLLS